MKLRKNIILLFFMFTLCVVRVDAATYNMILETQSLSVDENSNVDIFITLDNINGTTNGLNGCLADLKTDSNIVINSIENMNGWEVTQGNRLLLDGSNVFNRTQIAKINATVKGETILSLTNITCSDGEDDYTTSNADLCLKINYAHTESSTTTTTTTTTSNIINNEYESSTTVDSEQTGVNSILLIMLVLIILTLFIIKINNKYNLFKKNI